MDEHGPARQEGPAAEHRLQEVAGQGRRGGGRELVRRTRRQCAGRPRRVPAGRPRPAAGLRGPDGPDHERQLVRRFRGAERGADHRRRHGRPGDRAARRTGLRGRRPALPPPARPRRYVRWRPAPRPGRGALRRAGPRRCRCRGRCRGRTPAHRGVPPGDRELGRIPLRITVRAPVGTADHRCDRPGHRSAGSARTRHRGEPAVRAGVAQRPPRHPSQLPGTAGAGLRDPADRCGRRGPRRHQRQLHAGRRRLGRRRARTARLHPGDRRPPRTARPQSPALATDGVA